MIVSPHYCFCIYMHLEHEILKLKEDTIIYFTHQKYKPNFGIKIIELLSFAMAIWPSLCMWYTSNPFPFSKYNILKPNVFYGVFDWWSHFLYLKSKRYCRKSRLALGVREMKWNILIWVSHSTGCINLYFIVYCCSLHYRLCFIPV